MYPKKAVELYMKYDKCASDVVHELGYPNRKTLSNWYKEYLKEIETGVAWDKFLKTDKYTQEQKQAAIVHYLEYGRNLPRPVSIGAMNWLQGLSKHVRAVYNTPKSRKKQP